MPGIYSKNKFDLAGFSVGIVSKRKIIGKNNVRENNIILAIPSNGVHSNGYSLIRKIINKKKIDTSLKKELLKPTKIYTKEVLKLVDKNLVNAASHITGGGIIENITRSVPDDLCVNIDLSKIKIGKVFKWIKKNNVSDTEMLKTFNCGIGFCLIVSKNNVSKIKNKFLGRFKPYEIGHISKSKNKIILSNYLKW